jgi:hypothetical protein
VVEKLSVIRSILGLAPLARYAGAERRQKMLSAADSGLDMWNSKLGARDKPAHCVGPGVRSAYVANKCRNKVLSQSSCRRATNLSACRRASSRAERLWWWGSVLNRPRRMLSCTWKPRAATVPSPRSLLTVFWLPFPASACQLLAHASSCSRCQRALDHETRESLSPLSASLVQHAPAGSPLHSCREPLRQSSILKRPASHAVDCR